MAETSVHTINERAAEEFFRRGSDAEKDGNIEKAIDFYERALSEDSDHEQACFRLAVLYDRYGEDKQAIELLERLCTSPPVHINALMNLAVLYEDHNMFDNAARCLRTVLASNPNHERARLYLKDVEDARANFRDEDESGERRPVAMDVLITDFELSVRSRNCLKKMNIRTLGDLLRTTERDLLASKNFGDTSLNEIKTMLANRGLRLGQAATPAASHGESDLPVELAQKTVADLELSVRSRKALQRLNIMTVGELTSRTEAELLGCKNFGQTSLNEIKQVLASFGLSLRKIDS